MPVVQPYYNHEIKIWIGEKTSHTKIQAQKLMPDIQICSWSYDVTSLYLEDLQYLLYWNQKRTMFLPLRTVVKLEKNVEI